MSERLITWREFFTGVVEVPSIPHYLNRTERERWLYLFYPEIHKAIYQ